MNLAKSWSLPFALLCLLGSPLWAQQGPGAVTPPTIADVALLGWDAAGLRNPVEYPQRGHFALVFAADGTRLMVGGRTILELADQCVCSLGDSQLIGSAGGAWFVSWTQGVLLRVDGVHAAEPILSAPESAQLLREQGELALSPSGRELLGHGSYYSHHSGEIVRIDLATRRRTVLPECTLAITAIAWSPNERLLALAFAVRDAGIAYGVAVFDPDGKRLVFQRADRERPVTALAFDLDGSSLLWSGRHLQRLDLRTGERTAWGDGDLQWVQPITADHVLGHDGRRWTWFASRTLRTVQQVDAKLPGDASLSVTAIAPARDVAAVAASDGLHLYRLGK